MTQAKRKTKKSLFYPQSVNVRISLRKRKKLVNLCVAGYRYNCTRMKSVKRLRKSFQNYSNSELRDILRSHN